MPFLKLLGSIDFGGSVLERSSSFSVEENAVYNLALGSRVLDIGISAPGFTGSTRAPQVAASEAHPLFPTTTLDVLFSMGQRHLSSLGFTDQGS